MNSFSIAFYNTENFFDIYNDPQKLDNEYEPYGSRKWTQKRYDNKVWKISSVLSELGLRETGNPPLIVGLAEIESEKVLKDLVEAEHLKEYAYGFIHFVSQDERGMDTALLYRKNFVEMIHSEPIQNSFFREDGREDFTRDVLYTQFKIEGNLIHCFTIHLPSRRDNDFNKDFRNLILKTIRKKADVILEANPLAQIIVMGDFNGNPTDENAREILITSEEEGFKNDEFYNPMLKMRYGNGTLKHEGRWILFDQMLFSKSFFTNSENFIQFQSAHIYKDKSIQDWDRRFKGSPFRTYAGTKYLGGYSDHFPIYAILNH